jgi:hypothetical protein
VSLWLTSVVCEKGVGGLANYLLLHCEITSALSSTIFCCLVLAWVLPRSVVDLFACGRGLRGSLQCAPVWKMVLPCLLWCLWREINVRRLKDHGRTVVELKCFFFKNLYHWTGALDLNLLVFMNFSTCFLFLVRFFLLYTACVLRLRLLHF